MSGLVIAAGIAPAVGTPGPANGPSSQTLPKIDPPKNIEIYLVAGQTSMLPDGVTPSAKVQLNWSAPSAHGPNPITGYRVQWRTKDSGLNFAQEDTEGPSIVIGNLYPQMTYEFQISTLSYARVRSDVFALTSDPAVTFGTPATCASVCAIPQIDPPTGLQLSMTTTSRGNLEWVEPAEHGPNPITGYRVQWRLKGASGPPSQAVSPGTRMVINGLQPNSTYEFQVEAKSTVGKAPLTSRVATGTPSLLFYARTDNSVHFMYSATQGRGSITGAADQVIQRRDNKYSGSAVTAVPGTACSRFTSWSDGVATATRQDRNSTGADLSVHANFAVGYAENDTLQSVIGFGSINATTPEDANSACRYDAQFNFGPTTIASHDVYCPNVYGSAYSIGALCGQTWDFPEGSQFYAEHPEFAYPKVWIDGVDQGRISQYTFRDLPTPHSMRVVFGYAPVTINYTKTGGGSIVGATTQTLNYGMNFAPGSPQQTSTVVATPGRCSRFIEWSDGIRTPERRDTAQATNTTYTAIFEPAKTFGIAVSQLGLRGPKYANVVNSDLVSVSPASPRWDCGTNVRYSFTKPSGSAFDFPMVTVDGQNLGRMRTFTFQNLSASHVMSLDFRRLTKLSYTAEGPGTIQGESTQLVQSGGVGTSVTAKPNDTCSRFVSWSDGSTTAVRTDRYSASVSSAELKATFAKNTYPINVTIAGGGSVVPASPINADCGQNMLVTFTPGSGNKVSSVIVDGQSQGGISSWTFTNVQGPHSVTVNFEAIPVVTGPVQPATPGGGCPTDYIVGDGGVCVPPHYT